MNLLVQERFSIVVALDTNKDMRISSIARSFISLGLIDSITTVTSTKSHGICIRESQQINRIWISLDLTVTAGSFWLFNFRNRNHRTVIVDLDKANIFGSTSLFIFSTKIRRLIFSNHSVVLLYLNYAKEK